MNVDPVGITAVVIIALELIFWVFVGGAIGKWLRHKHQP